MNTLTRVSWGLFLLAIPSSAHNHRVLKRFGTINGLGQHAEHEHITRAAYACQGAETAASGNCFEPNSLNQMAGHSGSLGAIGAPDAVPPEGPQAHFDDADYIDIPGYPHSRAAANIALGNAVTHLHGRFKQGITFAAGILDSKQKIRPEQVALTKDDGSPDDCTFAYSVPGTGRAKCSAIEGLGRALHGVQDFYSHSNWADFARANDPISDVNPPGLGISTLAPFLDFYGASPPGLGAISVNLTTGCFTFPRDDTPGKGDCEHRVTHHTLNKDHAFIDANGVATLPADAGTPRSETVGNLQAAVSIAVRDSKRQWTQFKENLRTTYGAERGNTIICAIVRDDPVKSCNGRRIAVVIDSSGSNQDTDPSNFRVLAGRQFNDKLITKANAGPGELPDEVAVIDFDDSARVIYPMGDPAGADPSFSGIDSYGGTDIGSGIALGIEELINTRPPPAGGSNTPYEEDKAGLVVLTDGQDGNPAYQIAQLQRAATLKIRVAMGFLSAPTNPVPINPRSNTIEKRAVDPNILAAVLATGGIFATIDSAEAQQNFVQLVYKKGITGINGAPKDALELLPGLVVGRIISDATGPDTFYYLATAGEQLVLSVVDSTARSLGVVVTDSNSGVVIASGTTSTPNLVFRFTAAANTVYRIIVTPPAGLPAGSYTIGFSSSIPIRPPTTTTSAAPTTTLPSDCHHNNCYRALTRATITNFCPQYLAGSVTAIPTNINAQCSSLPSKISSACSCIVTGVN